jgi:hydrogenase expression/formation protein HypC
VTTLSRIDLRDHAEEPINMCLAVPARITSIDGFNAVVDMGGVTRETSLQLVPDARLGDYVLIHAGFAIQTLDEQDALETLRLFDQLLACAAGSEPATLAAED